MLVRLIYEEGQSIRQAAIASHIYYPTAKAINKIYLAEKRIDKKQHRFRKITPRLASASSKTLTSQDEQTSASKVVTMLKPIREELDFGLDIYESLDEEMIDVTVERIEDARRQNMPFDHYRIAKVTDLTT